MSCYCGDRGYTPDYTNIKKAPFLRRWSESLQCVCSTHTHTHTDLTSNASELIKEGAFLNILHTKKNPH